MFRFCRGSGQTEWGGNGSYDARVPGTFDPRISLSPVHCGANEWVNCGPHTLNWQHSYHVHIMIWQIKVVARWGVQLFPEDISFIQPWTKLNYLLSLSAKRNISETDRRRHTRRCIVGKFVLNLYLHFNAAALSSSSAMPPQWKGTQEYSSKRRPLVAV